MYLFTSVIGALFTIIPTIHGALLDLAGPFTITRYQGDIGAVPMRNCMNFKFDLVMNEFCAGSWTSVIHVGNDDSFVNQINQRMISILMHPNLPDIFHISATTTSAEAGLSLGTTAGNPYRNVGPAAGLSLGTVYSFDITYDQPGFTVIVNDEVLYENANWGNHCVSGETCHGVPVADQVPIQIGQDWYRDFDAEISNLLITDCEDLCANVDCDDGNLCTDEYCDDNTGACVSSDVDCTDADACTIDSCDTATGLCVHEVKPCSNGNICDGEEACVEGECVSPNDFDCPTNFLCDEDLQQCVADCSSFPIDGYLTDCSAEFDDQATQLDAVGADLTALTTFSSVLEERIGENAANIESGDALFDLLKDEVADNTADIANILAALATIHSGTDLGTDTSAASSGSFSVDLTEFTTKYNGELMVFLVAMNVMLLIILGICYCRSDSSKRYAPVQMYATTDDESMQLKQ